MLLGKNILVPTVYIIFQSFVDLTDKYQENLTFQIKEEINLCVSFYQVDIKHFVHCRRPYINL